LFIPLCNVQKYFFLFIKTIYLLEIGLIYMINSETISVAPSIMNDNSKACCPIICADTWWVQVYYKTHCKAGIFVVKCSFEKQSFQTTKQKSYKSGKFYIVGQ
jgi:hypothetical protein